MRGLGITRKVRNDEESRDIKCKIPIAELRRGRRSGEESGGGFIEASSGDGDASVTGPALGIEFHILFHIIAFGIKSFPPA